MGDWDCDGVDTPGLYRQSDGYVYLRNSNSQGIADIDFFFGNPGDVPIAGDFDGDGCDTVSIYRPHEAAFYIINRLGTEGGGLGVADVSYVFGNPGDRPFTGDFDGDGIDTVGLHRPSTGLMYLRNSHTPGNADVQFIFGDPGDTVVAGDWDGDGQDSPGVFRPDEARFYLRFENSAGPADVDFLYGQEGWLAVAGHVG
jgi:lysyl endopeptidase